MGAGDLIKVVHISTSSNHGGAAVIARKLHEGLKACHDYESEILTREEDFSVRTILSVLNYRLFGRDIFFGDKIFWNALLRKSYFKDKILHIHNAHGYYLPLELLESVVDQAKRVIVTLHDFWWATGRCAYPPLDCSEQVNSCKSCNYLDIYPRTIFKKDFTADYLSKRKILNNKKIFLVAPSSAMVNDLKKRLNFNFEVEVILNGVDVDCCTEVKERDTLISGLDNLSFQKGGDLALEMLSRANDTDVFDVLANDFEKVKSLTKEFKCKINLIKAPNGHKNFCKLLELYKFIVIPSRFETFGLLALESSMLGVRPIVKKLDVFQEVLGNYPIYVEDFYDGWKSRSVAQKPFESNKLLTCSEMIEGYKKLYRRSLNA